MKGYRRLLVLLTIFVTAFGLVGTASAEKVFHANYDLTGLGLGNPCNGENIVVTSGVLKEKFTITINDNNLSYRYSLSTAGVKGTGDQGNEYTLGGGYSEALHVSLNPDSQKFDVVVNAPFRATSKGSAENFHANIQVRITVDKDGNLTRFDFAITAECRG